MRDGTGSSKGTSINPQDLLTVRSCGVKMLEHFRQQAMQVLPVLCLYRHLPCGTIPPGVYTPPPCHGMLHLYLTNKAKRCKVENFNINDLRKRYKVENPNKSVATKISPTNLFLGACLSGFQKNLNCP